MRRSFNRLSALLELVDEGMAHARRETLEQSDAEDARRLRILERVYFRFSTRSHDPRLSLLVLKAIAPLLAEGPLFDARIKAFAERNAEALAHVYGAYEDDLRQVFIGQPESIALFDLLENSRPELIEAWNGAGLPETAIEDIAAVWAD